MSVDPRFDDMLFAILNNVGGIQKFLEIVFSFLYRRTDFFKVQTSIEEKHGLPPGFAQKIVKTISQKYVQLEKTKMAHTDPGAGTASAGNGRAVKSAEKKSSIKKEETADNSASVKVDCASQDHDLPKQDSNDNKQDDSHKAEEKEVKTDMECKEKSVETSHKSIEQKQSEAAKEEEERRYYTSDPESYNGASYDNYSWAQNNSELDVQVKVPNGVKGKDQVKILVEKTHLQVDAFQDEKWQTLLDGKLMYEVKVNSSTWTLHPNDHVHINVEKGYPRYWEALLEGEPKLNVRTIDCSVPFEDIDEEAQAKLQQMMFDQHQKRLGKPTSEEIKVQEMLKQAWNKKGSPFRGQEFDPSVLHLSQ